MTETLQHTSSQEPYIPRVNIVNETYDEHGVKWRDVKVGDISDVAAGGEEFRAQIERMNEDLRSHPEWEGPVLVDSEDRSRGMLTRNPVSEAVYSDPGMQEWWSRAVPTAMALAPLQMTDMTEFPWSGNTIPESTKEFFTHAIDSIGIRTRGVIMSEIAAKYCDGDNPKKWVSLACGAAIPVFQALENQHGTSTTHLHLVDWDTNALEFAEKIAEGRGLKKGQDYTELVRDLKRDLFLSDNLVNEIGPESADMVDALGIFEYFKDDVAKLFLHNAYKMVKPGGAIVIANMLDTHPQLDFNERGVGWPKIHPRSRERLVDVIVGAGIERSQVLATVAKDGVYSVFEIKKPEK